jgi:hypothetical protein
VSLEGTEGYDQPAETAKWRAAEAGHTARRRVELVLAAEGAGAAVERSNDELVARSGGFVVSRGLARIAALGGQSPYGAKGGAGGSVACGFDHDALTEGLRPSVDGRDRQGARIRSRVLVGVEDVELGRQR